MDAEIRHEKAVDHVLGGQHQLDGPADRDVQLVDLALPFGMLKLPHPLLADDVNDRGVVRGAIGAEVDRRSPDEDDHEDRQRRQRPEQLQRDVGRRRRRRGGVAGAAPVADREIDEQHRDQQADRAA